MMVDLGLYIPAHKERDFISFLKMDYGINVADLTDENISKYVSIFIYGKDEPAKADASQVVTRVEKSEEEVFDEVVKDKLNHVDWNEVSDIIWMPAVTKDTADYIYAIEVYSRNTILKRIVMRDKEKSIRFLSYINKLFIKAIGEQDKRNIDYR